jgi:hypothetical protein
MDELFTIIGKLYIDLVQSQKFIDNLQKQLQSVKDPIVADTKDDN